MRNRDIILVVGAGTLGMVGIVSAQAVGVGEVVSMPDIRPIRLTADPMQRIDRELLVRELMYEPTVARQRPARDWEQRERKKRRR